MCPIADSEVTDNQFLSDTGVSQVVSPSPLG